MELGLKQLIRIGFNTDVVKTSRLPWVDYAKGIAILLVAYRHILIGFDRSGLAVSLPLMHANEIFYSFRMPLFFFLSGNFLGGSLVKRGAQKLLLNKCKTLLYPYILWAIIQITLQILFSKYTNANRSIRDYGYILTKPDALDQLWYLFALFNVALIYIFFKSFVRLRTWQQIILGIIFHSMSLIFVDGPWHDLLYYYLFYAIGDALSSFMLNRSLYKYYGSWKVFFILLPLFGISQWYFIHHENIQYTQIYLFAVVALIGCAFMLNICFKMQQWGKMRFLQIVGYHSLYIYVMHVMIVSAFRSFFVNIVHINSVPLLLVINLILGMALSIIIYNICLRSGLWFMFGLDRSRVLIPKMKSPGVAKSARQNVVASL